MKTLMIRNLLLALLCSAAMTAFAQWTWVDNDGRKVFSDRPPPPEVAENKILQRPNVVRAAPAATPAKAAGTAATPADPAKPIVATVAKPSAADKEMGDKLKKAEAAETERKQAEQNRVAATKADNCQRAQQSKTTYAAGVPIARINAQGERELMDEAARNAETQRIERIIATDCR
ncbi:MAG: DUF4124 domain-containing protein [Burkholderiales bacterium]